MKNNKFNINWPRVLFIVLLFCIICMLVYAAIFYRSVMQTKTEGFEAAESFVLDESEMKNVEEMTYFQADVGFFTFKAVNEDKEPFFVFLQDQTPFQKDQLYVLPAIDFLSQDELEQEMFDECTNCTLIHSTPAMIDELPLWELTYTDEANRYVIEYKYLENGDTFEKLRLTRKFKKD